MMSISLFKNPSTGSGKPFRIAATGDVCATRGFEAAFLSNPLEEVVDSKILSTFHSMDLVVANIESVLTTSDDFALPGYALRSDPKLATLFSEMGIDIATLANNHIRDVRDVGVRDTLLHLKEAGVETTGAGMNLEKAEHPWTGEVKGQRIGIVAVAEREYNIATATDAGAAPLDNGRLAITIQKIRPCVDILIVSIHAGHEFFLSPSPCTVEAFRKAVDAGADVVIGHHPHVLQGFEMYRGKPIFYSLGNFCFDSDYVCQYPHWETGGIALLEFQGTNFARADLLPFHIERGRRIKTFASDALATFETWFADLCKRVSSPESIATAWRKEVKWRFERDLLPPFKKLESELVGPSAFHRARLWRNLFTCPSHLEMMREAFDACMEDGGLSKTNTK